MFSLLYTDELISDIFGNLLEKYFMAWHLSY